MTRRCALTGKGVLFGHNVSHANNKSNHLNLTITYANAQTTNCKYAILNFYKYILHRAIVIYNTIEKLCIQ